jgi:hypothetical protein
LSPKGNGIKVHLKTEKSGSQEHSSKIMNDGLKKRMQTEALGKEPGQLRARLKEEMR